MLQNTDRVGMAEELLGVDQTLGGMDPAHQGFGAEEPPGAELEHRLVVHHQLLLLDGTTDLGLQGHPAQRRLVERRVVEHDPPPPRLLGPVQGGVGSPHHLVGTESLLPEGEPRADGGDHRQGAVRGGMLRRDDVGRRGAHLRDIRALDRRHELVTTEACDRVCPELCSELVCDLRDEPVADLVAEAVVDGLEVVDVDEEHGQLGLRGPSPGGEAVGEAHPVAQACEPVVAGLIGEALHGAGEACGELAVLGDRQGLAQQQQPGDGDHHRHRVADVAQVQSHVEQAEQQCHASQPRRHHGEHRFEAVGAPGAASVLRAGQLPARAGDHHEADHPPGVEHERRLVPGPGCAEHEEREVRDGHEGYAQGEQAERHPGPLAHREEHREHHHHQEGVGDGIQQVDRRLRRRGRFTAAGHDAQADHPHDQQQG